MHEEKKQSLRQWFNKGINRFWNVFNMELSQDTVDEVLHEVGVNDLAVVSPAVKRALAQVITYHGEDVVAKHLGDKNFVDHCMFNDEAMATISCVPYENAVADEYSMIVNIGRIDQDWYQNKVLYQPQSEAAEGMRWVLLVVAVFLLFIGVLATGAMPPMAIAAVTVIALVIPKIVSSRLAENRISRLEQISREEFCSQYKAFEETFSQLPEEDSIIERPNQYKFSDEFVDFARTNGFRAEQVIQAIRTLNRHSIANRYHHEDQKHYEAFLRMALLDQGGDEEKNHRVQALYLLRHKFKSSKWGDENPYFTLDQAERLAHKNVLPRCQTYNHTNDYRYNTSLKAHDSLEEIERRVQIAINIADGVNRALFSRELSKIFSSDNPEELYNNYGKVVNFDALENKAVSELTANPVSRPTSLVDGSLTEEVDTSHKP